MRLQRYVLKTAVLFSLMAACAEIDVSVVLYMRQGMPPVPVLRLQGMRQPALVYRIRHQEIRLQRLDSPILLPALLLRLWDIIILRKGNILLQSGRLTMFLLLI